MLNSEEDTVKEDEDTALNDSRLASIANGDFDWLGGGFLDVVKNDIEKSNTPEGQKDDKPS